MMKKYLLAALTGLPFVLLAQNCEDVLQRAKIEFDRGHFVGIPNLLEGCLRHGFSSEQRARAYQMLAYIDILLGHTKEADDNYLNLLRANPKFSPTVQNDPIGLVYLSKKFTAAPIFEPYIQTAFSTAYPYYYAPVNLNPYVQPVERKFNFGMELGGGVNWNWSERWALGMGLNLAYRAVNTRSSGISGSDELTAGERMFWVDIPIFLKFSFPAHKNSPYLFAGAQADFLWVDNVVINGLYNIVDGNNGTPFKSAVVNITKSRNRANAAVLTGVGTNFRRGQSAWFMEARISIGITPVVSKSGNYYDDHWNELSKNTTQFRWVSAFYTLNYLSLSAGYIFPHYQPRKIKENFFTRFFTGKKIRK